MIPGEFHPFSYNPKYGRSTTNVVPFEVSCPSRTAMGDIAITSTTQLAIMFQHRAQHRLGQHDRIFIFFYKAPIIRPNLKGEILLQVLDDHHLSAF